MNKRISMQSVNNTLIEDSIPHHRLSNIAWFFAIIFLSFGIISEVLFALADQHFSTTEFSQIFSTLIIFMSWLHFRPDTEIDDFASNPNLEKLRYSLNVCRYQENPYLSETQARMTELKQYHMISQEYVLPFPYLCQIYHLLNLKHLEKVHSFSLSNLKILQVSNFRLTNHGGTLKFQTALDSSINSLRIWRKPIAEADLTLHTPYTVELAIPVYGDKKIIVMFNTIPLTEQEHQLFIDIYSNLAFPKPVLQLILHIASCLTVFEDLPYLRQLSERNLEGLIRSEKISNHETMSLFKRYAELYGQGIPQAI
ncbi:MAG TPA: hypothetical protein V6C57_20265 [Coleofasciculaceae cyanobacterium]